MSSVRDRHPGAPRPVSRAQRLLRATLLLVSVLWVPVSVALAITGVLLWVSVPLSVLTVVAGVYPKPLLEIVEPSFQAILDGALRTIG